MYEKISKWFKQGLWSEAMVLNAVAKGVLTPEESNKILGKEVA